MAQHRLILPLLALALAAPALGAGTKTPDPAPAATPPSPVEQLLIKRNYKAAFDLLLASAQAGDAKAMVKLASAYRYGLGTARDEAAAQAWYAKAAAAGNKEASLALQRQQVSVPPTVKKAAAAEAGSPGLQTVDFTHLPDRPKGAPDWASLAAAQQNHVALNALQAGNGGDVQLIQASLGDGEGLKGIKPGSATDALGRSALMLAVVNHKPEALAALLAAGPDLAAQDKQGLTAAGLAAQACDAAALEQLAAAGADLAAGATPPVVLAAQSCDDWSRLKPVFSKVDVNAPDRLGRTAGFYAAARGDIALLGWLADRGANLAAADGDGLTPLHSAALAAKPDALRFLLDKTGKSSLDSKSKLTPLMLAASSGCVGCIAALLDFKPDLDQKNADGDTALMFAVRALQGMAAQKLADSGANPNAKNNAGDTPLKLGLRLGLTQIKAAN